MSKRILAVRNHDANEISSKIVTRSSAKRLKSEEKAKEKENVESSSIVENPPIQNEEQQEEDSTVNKEYEMISKRGSTPQLVSKTAIFWSSKYEKVIRHVYPDAYGLHIHNDFSCYGELEIVENCLLDLAKAIFFLQDKTKSPERVNYVLAFRRLEALTILLDQTDGISGIDDGERFYEVMRVIGACYVTILRGLLPKQMFKLLNENDSNLKNILEKIAKKLPNFAQVLEKSIVVGYFFLQIADTFSSYTNILRIVYLNWIFLMENRTIDVKRSAPKGKEDFWKALKQAEQIEKNGIEDGGPESFNFIRELEDYKRNQGRIGGDHHDLRKWSKADRAQYSLDRFDDVDEMEDFFFF